MNLAIKFYTLLAMEMLKGAMNFINIALQYCTIEIDNPDSPEELTKNKQAVTLMNSKQKIAEALNFIHTMVEMDYNGKNN